ncbi:MAG TPA: isoprenylcysteine carboxylmethyltransferase family protein [Polyangiaceae bacterium]|nr:isoprenylcysteine carboxylmethyltransferase family protein [Polyangiaceae bacterium]
MSRALATALVAGFFVVNAVQERDFRRRGLDTAGTLPLARPLFLVGKAAMILAWLSIVVQSYLLDLRVLDAGPIVTRLAVLVEALGLGLVFLGYRHLGDSNQMGLGRPPVELVTRGLYRVTRNPVYLGFFLLTAAAVAYTQNPLVLALAVVAVAVHHAIVRAEEAHLERELGEPYRAYCRRVRRYL